jgi:hypothetical protein
MIEVAKAIAEAQWRRFDAVLWPGGYLKVATQFGALSGPERLKRLASEPWASWPTRAADELQALSPGALVVLGIDTIRLSWEFRGDELMAAWDAGGIRGAARKTFPADGDTSGAGLRPFLLYDTDGADPARMVELPNGELATLSVCYDAFLFNELALGPTGKRSAMRYIADPAARWRWATPKDRTDIVEGFRALHAAKMPTVALIGIHRFKRPGSDFRWQRHGIATSSAGVGGGLAVAASHFTQRLPPLAPPTSPLASVAVPAEQFAAGLHRPSHRLLPVAQFRLQSRVSGLAALVRLYDAKGGEDGGAAS